MKTRIATKLPLFLAATAVAVLLHGGTFGKDRVAHTRCSQITTAPVSVFQSWCSSTSYFRTFMPFANDPCNHLPSQKSFC